MVLAFGLSSLEGCSLLVRFDAEAQPCDGNMTCLDGYACVDNRCRLGASASDGGAQPLPPDASQSWDSMQWDEGQWQ